MTHNRLGHRFQRRLDVPVWLERGAQGFALGYANKVLAASPGNLIAYWPLWEPPSSAIADNYEGTEARDGAYAGVTLGEPGIGDGNTCPRFNGNHVNCYSASLAGVFDGDEGSFHCWIKVFNAAAWSAANMIAANFHRDGNNLVRLWSFAGGSPDLVLQREGSNIITREFFDPLLSTDWIAVGWNWSIAGNDARFFIDGALINNKAVAGAFIGVLAANLTTIGALDTADNEPFNGWIAHPALWNAPISDPDFASIGTL